MDLRRLSAGDWLAGVSGLALLVSLFLPWYEPRSLSAWEALTSFDVLLALVAATAVALPLITALQRVPAVPVALGSTVVLVGLAGVVLVLIRVLSLPGDAADREWGLWLALASTLGVLAGGCLAIRAEHWPGKREQVETTPAPQP